MKLLGRAEANLLLCCASTGNPDAEIGEILKLGLDWILVGALAQRHRVIPLLYRRLSRVAPDLLSRPELGQIAACFVGIARRNLYLTKELLLLIDLLGQNGIPAIPLKGPSLPLEAFGDLSSREFCDLDLLLRPADMAKARKLLASRGYRPEIKMDGAAEAAY